MPAYNAADFINESIKSVLAQSYQQWELIAVDDGSTDDTKNIIQEFALSDARIKYLYQKNGKQGKARNTGIANAIGKYIAFLDADDIWIPDKLAKQIELLIKTPASLVFSDFDTIDLNGNLLKETNGVINQQYGGEQGIKAFLKSNKIPILTVLAEKAAIEAANGFDEALETQYGEDYFLWLRMLLKGYVFISTTEKLASYRKHENQSIANTPGKAFQLIQGLHTLQVPENLQKDKLQAIHIWIDRYLIAINRIDKNQIKKILQFAPSALSKKVIEIMLSILPNGIVVKLIKLRFFF